MQWENGAYRTSNQQLYALLAECLEYGRPLPAEQSKQRRAELNGFLASNGCTPKKSTPLMTLIVKAVFGDVDRRRVSTYSLVLRAAGAESIEPEGLAKWIEDRRGVQEIKMGKSKTYIAPAAKIEQAQQSFDGLPELADVHSKQLGQLADAEFNGEYCVLLAEQGSDGHFSVRGITRAGGAVNAAFLAMYAEQQKLAA